jgi:uncharacterized protein DUF6262
MPPDRHAALTRAARDKHDSTRTRAIAAIRRLDRDGRPINFKAVAREAGVSRQWLYTQSDLREEIDRLRSAHPAEPVPIPARERASDASLRARNALLLEENRRLRSEVAELRQEIALAHGAARASA